MFVKVNCQFCRQPFDFDSSSGLPQIDCPHCGKQNHVELPAPKPELTIQHGAPNLSGAKPCPACRRQAARDATLCIHCGYNFATGKKSGEKGWLAANLGFVLLLAAVAIAAVAGGFYLLRPAETPPPPEAPAPVAVAPAPVAPVPAPAATDAPPAEPVAAPAPPPAPGRPGRARCRSSAGGAHPRVRGDVPHLIESSRS